MAWFEQRDLLHYFRTIDSDREMKRKFTFCCMMLTIQNRPVAIIKAPLQSKDRTSRIAEITLTYGGDDWCVARGIVRRIYNENFGSGGQRTRQEFEKLGLAIEAEGSLEDVWSELQQVDNQVNREIEQSYSAWRKEVGAKEEKQREKLLKELRSHQKGKFGRHNKGLFYLNAQLLDGEPIILISSELSKAIDKKYIEGADSLSSTEVTLTRCRGKYEQYESRKKIRFEFTGSSKVTVQIFRDALAAMGLTRSAIDIVGTGTITDQ